MAQETKQNVSGNKKMSQEIKTKCPREQKLNSPKNHLPNVLDMAVVNGFVVKLPLHILMYQINSRIN